MKAEDIKHLEWIYERLKFVYEENEQYDYMIKFRSILNNITDSGKVHECPSNKELPNMVDIYNATGKIPCLKCGMNLLKSKFYDVHCFERECRGMVIRMETLEIFAKEQGKELTWGK